jgi:superfamily II DNA or RNA helicase
MPKIIVSHDTKIELHDSYARDIKDYFTFENPQWIENEKRGRWNGKTVRYLWYYSIDGDYIVIPRGATGAIIRKLQGMGHKCQVIDNTLELPEIDIEFKGELREYQQKAVDNVLSKRFGVLNIPTGGGKTICAINTICQRKQKTLIIVHTSLLLNQWIDVLQKFTNLKKEDIGVIGGGKKDVKSVTVAMIQTLSKCVGTVKGEFGYVVVDESHILPAQRMFDTVSQLDSKYMLGMTATPTRRDGLAKLIYMALGDQTASVDRKDLVDGGNILTADVIIKETQFKSPIDFSDTYAKALSLLTKDQTRNEQIINDVSLTGGLNLVVSDRKEHIDLLYSRLIEKGFKVVKVTGSSSKKERLDAMEQLKDKDVKVLLATYQLIQEGFDCPKLSNLFMASPIKYSGKLIQAVGRILRPNGDAKAKVFDYVDYKVGVLVASHKSRLKTYEECNFNIIKE